MSDILSQWEALAKELIDERGDTLAPLTRVGTLANACLILIDMIRKKDEILKEISDIELGLRIEGGFVTDKIKQVLFNEWINPAKKALDLTEQLK